MTNLLNTFSKIVPIQPLKYLVGQKIIFPFYHSISDCPGPHLSQLGFSRNIQNFHSDIAFLLSHFEPVSLNGISEKTAKSRFHISFDDGLSDVYHNAIPFLIDNKLTATVFINSDFVDNKALFYRHKQSLIASQFEQEGILKKVSEVFSTSVENVMQKLMGLTYFETGKLDQIANHIGLDFDQFLKEKQPYLTKNQLVEIENAGFVIGNHSRNHPNFNTLNFEEQKKQILETEDFIKANFHQTESVFSFPFGDENIKNELFSWIYEELKMKYTFGVSGIKEDDFERHLHRIPMEIGDDKGDSILKSQYLYYLFKMIPGKNRRKR